MSSSDLRCGHWSIPSLRFVDVDDAGWKYGRAACSCRLVRMLQDPRACSACGGTVDIMIIDKALDDGRSIPTKIGACLRCGKWFNEAGLLELARLELRPREERTE